MIYDTNIDLVNDNVYTKFGLIRSIRFQDIEQKQNSDVNQGPQLCCKFAEIQTDPSFHACHFTCKNEEDLIKNEGARVFTTFFQI